MTDLDDLRRRVAALEDRVGLESGLRASADRDLSDQTRLVRAQDHLIEAVRLNQIDHGVRLGRIEDRLGGMAAQMGQVVGMLEELLRRGDGRP